MDHNDKLAAKIVRKILDDLCDRKGFRQAWEGSNQDIKVEIRNKLRAIVTTELRYSNLTHSDD